MNGGPADRLAPQVFTIPAGQPFIGALARAFLSGLLFRTALPPAPEEIAATTIFVPTRRAAQALGAALVEISPSKSMFLPRILPLGDAQDEISAMALPVEDVRLAPAIDPLRRRLAFFPLIDRWRQAIQSARDDGGPEAEPFFVAKSKADAFSLTHDLARLIDEAIIEDVPLGRLAEGLPEGYDPALHDRYWDLTARFIEIAAHHWPELLVELGMLDGAERSKQLLRRFVGLISASPTPSPLIVAGSTGSVSATAELMAAVARLPRGAVLLPGLDLLLDGPAWDAIGAAGSDLATRYAHPQSILRRTLQRIGIRREDVLRLPGLEVTAREGLVSEVFRPAEATDRWQAQALQGEALARATEGLALITAADEGEEALAIALMLREALETPGRTAALATPDRALARRVQNALARWSISVTDTAGEPLARSPAGALARLLLEAAQPEAPMAALLAVLRNPCCRLGVAAENGRLASTIEIAGMRGQRPRGGAAGLAQLLQGLVDGPVDGRAPAPRRRIPAALLAEAASHAQRLAMALQPLTQAFAGTPRFREAAQAHRAALRALTLPADGEADPLDCPAGAAVLALLDRIITCADAGPDVTGDDYALMFADLAGQETLPPGIAAHPRLKIWGLLEARLLEADLLVLGGLNEGVWPGEAQSDPFLNRPMRIALGLQPPERRIGQTAHDFAMLLGGRAVTLTRAEKREGTPTIASRFWRRLTAFCGAEATSAMTEAGQPYLDWARALDAPDRVTPVACPEPRIPAALMLTRLRLTEAETLVRDPYVLFARHVLGLDPLEMLSPPLDARDRGNAIHKALADYVQAGTAPEAGEALLRQFGEAAFAPMRMADAEAAEFWWRRFLELVPGFIGWDAERRGGAVRIDAEVSGGLTLTLPLGRTLRLSTRADRIEHRSDGSIAIIDYKSGAPPAARQVRSGLSPQLTLTAALAMRGGFPGLAGGTEPTIAYLQTGGAFHGKSFTPIGPEKGGESIALIAARHLAELEAALAAFTTGQRGFRSRRRMEKSRFTSDYDHLARHLEWSLGGEEDEA